MDFYHFNEFSCMPKYIYLTPEGDEIDPETGNTIIDTTGRIIDDVDTALSVI